VQNDPYGKDTSRMSIKGIIKTKMKSLVHGVTYSTTGAKPNPEPFEKHNEVEFSANGIQKSNARETIQKSNSKCEVK